MGSVDDLYRTLIDQFLSKIEGRQDSYFAVETGLRSYADALNGNVGDANVAVNRLLSSGSGEAMDALAAHWSKVMNHDAHSMEEAARATARVAGTIGAVIQTAKAENNEIAAACAMECVASLASGVLTFGASQPTVAASIGVAQTRSRNLLDRCYREIASDLSLLQSQESVSALPAIITDLAAGVGAGGGAYGGVAGGGTDPGRRWGSTLPDGSAGANLRVDHAEHERAANALRQEATEIWGAATAGTAQGAMGDHNNAAASGSLGAAIAPALGPILENISSATTELGAHLDGALARAIEQISLDQQATDEGNRKNMAELDG